MATVNPIFRFTIRDMLWLTVVVALAAGWYVEHRRQEARIDALDKQVQQMQAAAVYSARQTEQERQAKLKAIESATNPR